MSGFRHDLTDGIRAVVRREGDDSGPVAAIRIEDRETHIQLRIRTLDQAEALARVAIAARDALVDGMEAIALAEIAEEYSLRPRIENPSGTMSDLEACMVLAEAHSRLGLEVALGDVVASLPGPLDRVFDAVATLVDEDKEEVPV